MNCKKGKEIFLSLVLLILIFNITNAYAQETNNEKPNINIGFYPLFIPASPLIGIEIPIDKRQTIELQGCIFIIDNFRYLDLDYGDIGKYAGIKVELKYRNYAKDGIYGNYFGAFVGRRYMFSTYHYDKESDKIDIDEDSKETLSNRDTIKRYNTYAGIEIGRKSKLNKHLYVGNGVFAGVTDMREKFGWNSCYVGIDLLKTHIQF